MKSFFRPMDVSQLLGISYRQIQYWDKTNLVRPTYRRRGKYRLYTFANLLLAQFIQLLRNQGWTIQKTRPLAKQLHKMLPQTLSPLTELTIIVDEDRLILSDGDVMMTQSAREHYHVFRVSDLRDRINEKWDDLGDDISDATN